MTVETHVVPVAVASISAVGAGVIAGVIARAAIAGLKWLAKKTKTKKDDHFIAEMEEFLIEHPEAIPMIERIIRDWGK
jgi:hypothetical protein